MTSGLAILIMLPVAWLVPSLCARWIGGRRGIRLGVVLAFGATVGVAWCVAHGRAALFGLDADQEFDNAFSAWKIMLFAVPAVGLHLWRREVRTGDAATPGATGASGGGDRE